MVYESMHLPTSGSALFTHENINSAIYEFDSNLILAHASSITETPEFFWKSSSKENPLEKRRMELPTAPSHFANIGATMGRHTSAPFGQSPGSHHLGPLQVPHAPQALPFPTMRSGMLPSPPQAVSHTTNPLLNLLNKSPILASLHYQQQQQKQTAHQAMSQSSSIPTCLNGTSCPTVMDIYQLVSMARDSIKPKEIVRKSIFFSLKSDIFHFERCGFSSSINITLLDLDGFWEPIWTLKTLKLIL